MKLIVLVAAAGLSVGNAGQEKWHINNDLELEDIQRDMSDACRSCVKTFAHIGQQVEEDDSVSEVSGANLAGMLKVYCDEEGDDDNDAGQACHQEFTGLNDMSTTECRLCFNDRNPLEICENLAEQPGGWQACAKTSLIEKLKTSLHERSIREKIAEKAGFQTSMQGKCTSESQSGGA